MGSNTKPCFCKCYASELQSHPVIIFSVHIISFNLQTGLTETLCSLCLTRLTSVLGSELRCSSSIQEGFRLAGIQACPCSLRAASLGMPFCSWGMGCSCVLAYATAPESCVPHQHLFQPLSQIPQAFCTIWGKADIAKEPPFPTFLVLKGQCMFFIWESEFCFKGVLPHVGKVLCQSWVSTHL